MTDKALRARVEGREAVAARTSWQLDVRGFRVRCLREGPGAFQVQVRGQGSRGRWESTGDLCADPNDALQRVARALQRMLEDAS